MLLRDAPATALLDGTTHDDVTRHLRTSTFPADRTRLLVEAIENHAPPEFVALLEGLRPFDTYRTRRDVSTALGADVAASSAMV
jgi:hypothetical protein